MNRLTLLCCSFIVAFTGIAQNHETQTTTTTTTTTTTVRPGSKGYWGIRASLDVTSPGDVKYEHESASLYKSGAGFAISGIYHAYLGKKFYFEPGLTIFYNTTGLDNAVFASDPMFSNLKDAKFKSWGIRVPISFGIKFPIRTGFIGLYTGPTFSYGLKGTESLTVTSTFNEKVSANMYEDYNRFDFGWHIGIGVTFHQYYIGINSLLGVCNQLKHGNGMKWSNNVESISVGYNF